ncbi:helix-turn-helix transcriptional regulator [Ktedonobacter sp. SOSP1-85]|uniref:helix-turn-helix domain-containing protein n=1 Tax=Ktedonobacter sp. SOSP1-85 TaxID=2778367 RepID=UPI0019167E46|nr:helix-turn-helix transcriptional regulator [Ktedonobacter sp. SOSP1-85]
MGRHTRMQPNELLLRERQRRGWTREYVAGQIGIADAKTIGRWERGVAFPSAFFLQKLCELYARLPQELGLFRDDPPLYPYPACTHSCMHAFPQIIYDPALPLPQKNVLERQALLRSLKTCLCDQELPVCAALYGLPGIGKTSLAVTLARDQEITAHFCDGTLWASLGPSPDLVALLRHWGRVLGINEIFLERAESSETLAMLLRATIGPRRLLLLLDDAWTLENAQTLQVGGPHCAYLLTTRIPALAYHFANTASLQIPELSLEESLDLLASFIPDIREERYQPLRSLVSATGGLPLALCLLGKYLQAQANGRQPRRLQHALEYLSHASARLQLRMPSAFDEPGATWSLHECIERTTSRLDVCALRTLAMLAILPTKPLSFSEGAALAACAGVGDGATLDLLVDAGLLEVNDQGRYLLHPVIADYARTYHKSYGG